MNLKRKAFTLIEISIVLVIIGIILASVMKGRDLVKSSQIKEYNQVFVSQWVTIANSYFSRMGAVVADSTDNGGTAVDADGFMDNIEGSQTLTNALLASGINPCDLIKTSITAGVAVGGCVNEVDPFRRGVEGETVGKTTTRVSFQSRTIDGKRRNQLRIRFIPEDVAQALDTIIDGKPDGQAGSCIKAPNGGGTSLAWDGISAAATTMFIILDN